ncbi:MAG TPA: type II toxin-antitoxin system VapC family toxin [Solirubrobacterales bacterium]|nr:type II toxin-antitoxin system VapC family toxin [Solirubrobacterales bacterium]
MIVLDTNVISELARPAPSARVLAWVDAQDDVAITATTAAELLYGIARLPDGKHKARLAKGIEEMIDGPLRDKVLAFDRAAAYHYAEIVAGRDRAGHPITVADAQIAAICRSHQATLGTRNVRDFEAVDIVVINPWDDPVDGDA